MTRAGSVIAAAGPPWWAPVVTLAVGWASGVITELVRDRLARSQRRLDRAADREAARDAARARFQLDTLLAAQEVMIELNSVVLKIVVPRITRFNETGEWPATGVVVTDPELERRHSEMAMELSKLRSRVGDDELRGAIETWSTWATQLWYAGSNADAHPALSWLVENSSPLIGRIGDGVRRASEEAGA